MNGRNFSTYPTRCRVALGRKRSQTGMALVIVLWVVTLLTVIAASFSLGMRREAGTLRHLLEVAEARAAAEAGVRYAMLGLAESDRSAAWDADGRPRELEFGDIRLTIRVAHEASRIDLNAADSELIDGLLLSTGVSDANARAFLRDNILDWRDSSPHRRAEGLSVVDYRSAGLNYGPRNGPFLAVEELLLVPGVTPELYRRLSPLLTVHSRQSGVNFLGASEPVLMALPGIDAQAVSAYLERREAALEQGLPAPDLAGLGLGAPGAGAYSVYSVARLPSGLEQGVRVVLVPASAADQEPYTIVHYRLEKTP